MTDIDLIPQTARHFVLSVTPVGSRVTCNPPPSDTDRDFLVAVSQFQAVADDLFAAGFSLDGDERHLKMNRTSFNSFRLGDLNLIVTDDEDFHSRFLAASSVAKRLNLLAKADRIALFQAVLYGNTCCDPAADILDQVAA